jgi:uncharacterized ferritin-like protein (DUF455 family)
LPRLLDDRLQASPRGIEQPLELQRPSFAVLRHRPRVHTHFLQGPFDVDARRAAGFSDAEIDFLTQAIE